MTNHALVGDSKTVAIVGGQFGDEGKGKFVALLATDWADFVVRGTGGANAGHTIYRGDQKFVCHLLPSGVASDKCDLVNVIGTGVAFDPVAARDELTQLGFAPNLLISHRARLVLPHHLLLDRIRECGKEEKPIGTTGRGIGPAYADHTARVGLVVNDLLNPDVLARKLRRNLEEKLTILRSYDPQIIRAILNHPDLGSGAYFNEHSLIDCDAVIESYGQFGRMFNDMIVDTDSLLQRAVGRKRILLEGAQAVLLSVACGIHPHVTSSDCSLNGLATGAGLDAAQIDTSLLVVKAPYMTRVGEGPLPTEFGGNQSADWCRSSEATAEREQAVIPTPTINDSDEFSQGIGFRIVGNEYGATTRRLRRTGWLDLPLLRYAVQFGGRNVVLTKLDVANGCNELKICDSYCYTGPNYHVGERLLRNGEQLSEAIPDRNVLEHCQPNYSCFPGWEAIPQDDNEPLPKPLEQYLSALRRGVDGINIVALSTGPHDTQTRFVGSSFSLYA